ncbi:MAG: transcriptional activator RfaH, partial [Pseudomonadota bacterium]|nr:transcriptional activator RfaH [Pseudomonadota bacterium]
MLRWYLVRTKPNAEATACANLDRQGYETYFPRVDQPTPCRGRWRKRVVPLFPGYLFLRLDEGRQPLAPVRSTLGVACVVQFGASYAVVPDEVIHELRSHANP